MPGMLTRAAAAAAFLAGAQMLSPCAALAQSSGLSTAQMNGVKIGMPYKTARARLFAAGYAGVFAPRVAGRCSYREEICRAYTEAEDCAPTGLAPCRFEFKKRTGRKLVIITSGEELADLAVREIFREK